MAITSLASIAGALKQVYGQYQIQQNLQHRAMDEIAKSLTKYSPGGQGYYGAVNLSGNESVGAINELESFRSVDAENYAQYVIKPKINVAPIQFSGLAAAAAESDEQAFVSVVVDALDMAKERLLKDENRQFFGLGTGQLAAMAATTAAAATSCSVDTCQYLRANMVLDGYAGGTTLTVAGIRVSDVDKINNIVYFATSLGFAMTITTDVWVKQNIRVSAPTDGKEMMGLRGIVDDGTDLQTFQAVDSNVNKVWRGRRIAAAGANLTSDLLQQLLDDTMVLGGEEPDTIMAHPKQRRKYLDLVVPQKRYQDGSLDTGFTELSFNGKKMILDIDCQVDTIYALTKKHIQKYELEALAMGRQEGSDTFLRQLNADQFQAYWRHYCNFGTGKRNAHGKLTGLAVPAGAA